MRRHHEQPVVITSAPQSSDDEYDKRRKKYAVMMGLRAIAVLGAALTYHVSMILAIAFVVAGIVLPWCAVIVANTPARRQTPTMNRVRVPHERALPQANPRTKDPGNGRIVDG